MLLQPDVQRQQIWEVRHLLPQPRPSILDVLLYLTLFPTRGGIAELWCKDVMVRHREEAEINLSFLAAADAINCGAHVVIYSPRGHPTKHSEAVLMGIKKHLMRLEQVSPDQEGPTVR